MKYLLFSFICFLLLFTYSCKKETNNTQADCKTNNYGTLKVTYGSSDVKHSIITTLVGNSNIAQEKVSAIGISSDTIHIAPGSYTIDVSSLNSSNLALDQKDFPSYNILQCNETDLSVSF